jgi:hypothetical protein
MYSPQIKIEQLERQWKNTSGIEKSEQRDGLNRKFIFIVTSDFLAASNNILIDYVEPAAMDGADFEGWN